MLPATAELSLPLTIQVLCLPPRVLHPGPVSTSSDITDTPVCWDTGHRHSIWLFRKNKVLVLMKSLLENLRVQKSIWIQRAPEHWSRLPLHWHSMPCLAMRVNRAKWASSERFLYHLPHDLCLLPPFLCLRIDTVPAMIYNHPVKSFEWVSKVCSTDPQQ